MLLDKKMLFHKKSCFSWNFLFKSHGECCEEHYALLWNIHIGISYRNLFAKMLYLVIFYIVSEPSFMVAFLMQCFEY